MIVPKDSETQQGPTEEGPPCSADALDDVMDDFDESWDALMTQLAQRASRRERPKRNLSTKERREFRRRIAHAATLSWRFRGTYEILTVVLPAEYFANICRLYKRPASVPKAEMVCAWLTLLGFRADRTKKNLDGYPGLQRELRSPPPWVHVDIDDCDGPVAQSRARELRPLYQHIGGNTDLVKEFRLYLEQQDRETERWSDLGILPRLTMPKDGAAKVRQWRIEDFRDLVSLGRLLGTAQFEKLYEAVFDFDEFDPANGTPDLLVWNTKEQSWFFAEVKGPRDHLGPNQYRWIGENWDLIKGRIIILSIGEDRRGILPIVTRKAKRDERMRG